MITKIELPEDIFTDAARLFEIKAVLQNGVDGMDKFDCVLCHAEQMEHHLKPEDEPCHPEYWW